MVGIAAAGSQNRKQRDHSCNHKHKAERKLEHELGHELSKPSTSDTLPPARLQTPKVLETKFQIPEPMWAFLIWTITSNKKIFFPQIP